MQSQNIEIYDEFNELHFFYRMNGKQAHKDFYFLLPIHGIGTHKSITLGLNFRNGDFDGFTHFVSPLNPKIIFLTVSQFV